MTIIKIIRLLNCLRGGLLWELLLQCYQILVQYSPALEAKHVLHGGGMNQNVQKV